MDWLIELLKPGQESLASTILLYSFVIFTGIWLGKIKIFGVSLGVTFVLFVGILMGHFHYTAAPDTLNFLRDFGLILFIFSIGMQVGPGFFSSFKEGGVRLNVLALIGILLNVAIMVGLYYVQGGDTGSVRISEMVGVMSGAVTNTPGLGAAQQTVLMAMPDNQALAETFSQDMSMGYAAAYPLGVIGIIVAMLFIRRISRNFVISRLRKADGTLVIPTASTVLEMNDSLMAVISVQDEEIFRRFLGPVVEMDWESAEEFDPNHSHVVSRRVVVTKNEYNGKKLGELRLRMGFKLNVTRVTRAGVDLLASPNLRLQIGDRLTVVGKEEDISRLAARLGNSQKHLNEPNLVTMFIGIFLGIVVGSIPLSFPGMSVPMRLGLAGGPLIVAILISNYGHKYHLVTYTSSSANLLLREIGICLFLASVGIAAGAKFAETVFTPTGAVWVLNGFIITLLPLLVVGIIARGKYKLNYLTIMGLMSGGYTDPPALAYGNKVAGNDAPAVAYSTVYPLTMFMRVIMAQLLILFFFS